MTGANPVRSALQICTKVGETERPWHMESLKGQSWDPFLQPVYATVVSNSSELYCWWSRLCIWHAVSSNWKKLTIYIYNIQNILIIFRVDRYGYLSWFVLLPKELHCYFILIFWNIYIYIYIGRLIYDRSAVIKYDLNLFPLILWKCSSMKCHSSLVYQLKANK